MNRRRDTPGEPVLEEPSMLDQDSVDQDSVGPRGRPVTSAMPLLRHCSCSIPTQTRAFLVPNRVSPGTAREVPPQRVIARSTTGPRGGDRVAVARVVGVKRSAPRPPPRRAAQRRASPALFRGRLRRRMGCWTSTRRRNRRVLRGSTGRERSGSYAAIGREDGRAALVTVVRSPGFPAVGAKLLATADSAARGDA